MRYLCSDVTPRYITSLSWYWILGFVKAMYTYVYLYVIILTCVELYFVIKCISALESITGVSKLKLPLSLSCPSYSCYDHLIQCHRSFRCSNLCEHQSCEELEDLLLLHASAWFEAKLDSLKEIWINSCVYVYVTPKFTDNFNTFKNVELKLGTRLLAWCRIASSGILGNGVNITHWVYFQVRK